MANLPEIMRLGEHNAVVYEDACFREVLEVMDAKGLGSVCVTEGNRLLGIVTDGDVRRLILRTQDTLPDLFLKSVNKIMIKDPKVVSPETTLVDCLKILKMNRFWVIPVVDKERMLLGVVHMQDLLEAINNG